MFCSLLLVVVIHAGCDKQDSLIRGVCAVNCTVDRRSCCSHFTSHRSDSQIFVDNCDICLPRPPAFDAPPFLRGPRRNIAITFGKEKLEWCGWLPDDEKISKICLFVLTESTNVTDRDGRTDTAAWQHSITRQKKIEPILLQIGVSGPRDNGMKRSTFGVGRLKINVTRRHQT